MKEYAQGMKHHCLNVQMITFATLPASHASQQLESFVRLVRLTVLSDLLIVQGSLYIMHAAPVCNDNDVQLVGTDTPTQGRLEVCLYGVWGTVCDDGWTDRNSEVVCRQLGYENSGKRHYIVKFQ